MTKDAEIAKLWAELASAHASIDVFREGNRLLRAELAAAQQDAGRLRICAAALTPVSENEKRGMERVLAILDRKIAEGGGVVSTDAAAVERHNAHFRARWSAFQECAAMLRAALQGATTGRCPRCNSPSPERHPAVQFEGEVQLCPHPFHRAVLGKNDPR